MTTRDDIHELLPFLANDTLEGEERRAAEAAVAEDPELQTELAALRAVRETMRAEDAYSPGEMGLARLMRDVEAEAPQAAAPPRSGRVLAWQAAAAVLLVAVIGQGAFLMRGGGDMAEAPQPEGYSLAGAGAEAPFTVAIAPDTPERALRALLLEAGVEVTGGPSALGLYQLAPVEGVTPDEARGILEASDIVEDLTLNQ
ncbi:hypothetical protein P1J78_23340 [Psychromarinibacter sp. C21-152]|uniref:Uncharacterized protein n=1 Tax=Psychromarinibacter sediminicola TaxID=3033385 RepID=A0AAE3NWP4_9RHOB|nr:hypothetical protein [Psychromarinibacter sediminicola]MDF0603666.1 hypothetical protein [Psychromarinibacter sediminicola]